MNGRDLQMMVSITFRFFSPTWTGFDSAFLPCLHHCGEPASVDIFTCRSSEGSQSCLKWVRDLEPLVYSPIFPTQFIDAAMDQTWTFYMQNSAMDLTQKILSVETHRLNLASTGVFASQAEASINSALKCKENEKVCQKFLTQRSGMRLTFCFAFLCRSKIWIICWALKPKEQWHWSAFEESDSLPLPPIQFYSFPLTQHPSNPRICCQVRAEAGYWVPTLEVKQDFKKGLSFPVISPLKKWYLWLASMLIQGWLIKPTIWDWFKVNGSHLGTGPNSAGNLQVQQKKGGEESPFSVLSLASIKSFPAISISALFGGKGWLRECHLHALKRKLTKGKCIISQTFLFLSLLMMQQRKP